MNQAIFSKPEIDAEDVIDALKYCEQEDSKELEPDVMVRHIEIMDHLRQMVRERSSEVYKENNQLKSNFLPEFFYFCTGLLTMPSRYHGVSLFYSFELIICSQSKKLYIILCFCTNWTEF